MNINIIGMPIFYGCDNPGVEQGPKVLRENDIVEILKKEHNIIDLGDIDIPLVEPLTKFLSNNKMKYLNEVIDANTKLSHKVYSSLKDDSIPFILGGDHSLALGSLAGASKFFGNDLAVIWIDAHGDLNTEETSPSGNIHGMPLAASLGIGYEKLTAIMFEGKKVNPEHIFLLGCRDLDPGEIKLIDKLNISTWPIEEIKSKGIKLVTNELLSKLKDKSLHNIHLSYDIDCLDPTLVPGTGTPVENGLTLEESEYLLTGILSTSQVKCIDFVEYNPTLDRCDKTRKTCINLLNIISKNLK